MKRRAIIYLLILVTQGTEVNSSGEYHEPQCYSRFDYEYKVLQKLITLEEAQKGLTETLKTHENEETKQKLTSLEEAQKTLAEIFKIQENEIQDLKTEIKRLTDLSPTSTDNGPLVAFTAYIDSTKALSGNAFVFDKVLLNEPSAYDQSTGVFTCPVAGIYMISVVVAARGSTEAYARLKVNGETILEVVAEGTSSSHDLQGNNIGIVKLNVGDRVWVSGGGSLPGNSGGNSKTRTSSFSGVLLYPTTA